MTILPNVQYTLINIPEMDVSFNFKEAAKSISNEKIARLFSQIIEKKEILEKQLGDKIEIQKRFSYSLIGLSALSSAFIVLASTNKYFGSSILFALPIFSVIIPVVCLVALKMEKSNRKKTIFQLESLLKKLYEFDKLENNQPKMGEILQLCLLFDNSHSGAVINLEEVFSILQEFLPKDSIIHHFISNITDNNLSSEERNEAWKLLEKELNLNVLINYLQINDMIVSRFRTTLGLMRDLRNNEISLTPKTSIHIIPTSTKN